MGEQEAREIAATRAIWGGFWGGQVDRLEPISISEGEIIVGAYAGVQPLKWHKKAAQVLVLETTDGRLGHVRLASLDRVIILDRVPERAIIALHGKPWTERPSDRTIIDVASQSGGIYSAAHHHALKPDDRAVFIDRHLRRLDALSLEQACDALGDGRFFIPDDYAARAIAADRVRLGPTDITVRVLDVRPLQQQTSARGVTWLDQIAAGSTPGPQGGRLAQEVRTVLRDRASVLRTWGIGRQAEGALTGHDMLALWTIEMEVQSERLGAGVKPLVIAQEGHSFSGVYFDRAHMGGRTYAAIEGRTAVTLAPWRAGLEACRGQSLVGLVQAGRVEFRFGERDRTAGFER